MQSPFYIVSSPFLFQALHVVPFPCSLLSVPPSSPSLCSLLYVCIPSLCVSPSVYIPSLISVYVSSYRRCLLFSSYVLFLLSVYVPFPYISCLVYISSTSVFLLPSLFMSSLHICILFVCVFSIYVPSPSKSCLVYVPCPYVAPLPSRVCSFSVNVLACLSVYICFFLVFVAKSATYKNLRISADDVSRGMRLVIGSSHYAFHKIAITYIYIKFYGG